MIIDDSLLTKTEKIILSLRSLYSGSGYTAYRMNKFEPYDLYMRNKDFLLSENVITFNDTNGHLMALKPDVTLSIVKNSRFSDGSNRKLYYDEKVYRPGRKGDPFREITQIGLENLGDITDSDITQVLSLALRTLHVICDRCMLDVSNMDLLACVLDEMDAQGDIRISILNAIQQKSIHEAERITREAGLRFSPLASLLSCEGPLADALQKLNALCVSDNVKNIIYTTSHILAPLSGQAVQLDFSVQSDMRYYNGIVFSGFAEGIPEAVLRGGQYDRLVNRLGKDKSAIGFALYPDLIN